MTTDNLLALVGDETWKAIPGYAGYEASSFGRIRSWHSTVINQLREKPVIIDGWVEGAYRKAHLLADDGVRYRRGFHQLVAATFHGTRPHGLVTAHDNGNGLDNRPSNLVYKTQAGNAADKIRHGTSQIGERNGNSILTQEQVQEILVSTVGAIELAARYSVDRTTIWHIRSKAQWKHV